MGGPFDWPEVVFLLTTYLNRCLVLWAVGLLMLGLVWPVEAAEPTLARLSFWVPLGRMAEFEVAYEEQVVPILKICSQCSVIPSEKG